MTVYQGCLSAQIYQSGSWSIALQTGMGTTSCTVAASTTRYLSDLLTAVAAALDAGAVVLGDPTGFSASASVGEGGTGRVTITYTGGSPTLTWTSTDLRDLLGFTGSETWTLVTGSTYHVVGTESAESVWLPDCPMAAPYGPGDPGHTETDLAQTISPTGEVQTFIYESRTKLPSVTWTHVSKPKARISGETVVNASFERWWRNTQAAEKSYFRPASPVRLIWDADTPATYHTYRLISRMGTEMDRAVTDWAYLWSIGITGYRVPGT